MFVPATGAGPAVTSSGVMFRVHDGGFESVALFQEVAEVARQGRGARRRADRASWNLDRRGDWWIVDFPRTKVDRFEYLFDVTFVDGRRELGQDPGNPLRAAGPFGEKSVVEYPEYRAPAWLHHPDAPPGEMLDLDIACPTLGGRVQGQLWSTPGSSHEDPLPLLVVHDGPEYARYSQLVLMLERLTAAGKLPKLRAALLHPPWPRDAHYSASREYAQALAEQVLPAIHALAPVAPERRFRVGLGASLGALALLHVHRTYPATFGALFLQSGSFFHRRHDRYDLDFEHFQRVRNFLDRIHAERAWDDPIPVLLTCGAVEMNLANNRALARRLTRQGYSAQFVTGRDAHNWVAWRDLFEPHLVGLVQQVWA